MSEYKLKIDLLPRGAWGNNLRKRTKKEDWERLRNYCCEKARHKCVICGDGGDLDAHEVWEFDIENKTQILKDIVALCPACHGVVHIRNSRRIGYAEQSKAHFMKINNCGQMAFAKHYTDAILLFERRNMIYRWQLIADLRKFGGEGIQIRERNIPLIENPYENARQAEFFVKEKKLNSDAAPPSCPLPPKVRNVTVDNYDGTITVEADYADKIQWLSGGGVIKTKYNVGGRFTTEFSVEGLKEKAVKFKLLGGYGETSSQEFKLKKAQVIIPENMQGGYKIANG